MPDCNDFAEGDVVPLYVRLRGLYRPQGLATVRILTPGSVGGCGYEQRVVLIDSLGPPRPDLADSLYVPRASWR